MAEANCPGLFPNHYRADMCRPNGLNTPVGQLGNEVVTTGIRAPSAVIVISLSRAGIPMKLLPIETEVLSVKEALPLALNALATCSTGK